MLKKVSFIVLSIIFSVSYGCSSMKHSTIVLYVSHKVEGPLYMPQPEPPASAQKPQAEKVERENQAKQSSESKKPTRESKEAKENQANQSSEPAKASQDKKTTREGSQSPTQANQEAQESKPSQSKPSKTSGSQTTQQTSPSQVKKTTRDKKATQETTNTYKNGYQTRTLPRGEFLILEKPIRFAFEKYGISSYYDDTVQYVADFMKENTNFQLVVEGHTDRVGEYAFNRNLSLRRARSAISKLVRAGVDKNRLIESGVSYRFSEYNFNRLNRRVEFIIIKSPEELTNYREGIK